MGFCDRFIDNVGKRAMYSSQNMNVIVWNSVVKVALTWFVLPYILCHLLLDVQTSLQNGGSLSGAKVYQLHYVDNQDRTHSITELPAALGSNPFKTSNPDGAAEDEINRFFNDNLKSGRITMVAGVENLNLALLFVSVLLLVAYQARSSVWASFGEYRNTHYYLSVSVWLASPLVVAGFFFNGFRPGKWDITDAPDNGLFKVWVTAIGVSMWFFVIELYLRRKALKIQNWLKLSEDEDFDLQIDGNLSKYELASAVGILGMILVFAFAFLHFNKAITIVLVLLVVLGLAFVRHLARRLSLMTKTEDTEDIANVPPQLAVFILFLEVLFILLAIFFAVNHWELLASDHVKVFQSGDFFYDGNRFMISMVLIVLIMIVVGWIAKPWVHDLNLDMNVIATARRQIAARTASRKKPIIDTFTVEEMTQGKRRPVRLAPSATDRASLVRNSLNFV